MTKKKYEEIRRTRVMSGCTQEDVATVLGISIGTYSLKEQGKSEFTATELKVLSELFDKTTDELLA